MCIHHIRKRKNCQSSSFLQDVVEGIVSIDEAFKLFINLGCCSKLIRVFIKNCDDLDAANIFSFEVGMETFVGCFCGSPCSTFVSWERSLVFLETRNMLSLGSVVKVFENILLDVKFSLVGFVFNASSLSELSVVLFFLLLWELNIVKFIHIYRPWCAA